MFPFKGSFPLEELYNVLYGSMHSHTRGHLDPVIPTTPQVRQGSDQVSKSLKPKTKSRGHKRGGERQTQWTWETLQQDLPLEMKRSLWIFVPRSHPSVGLRHYSTLLASPFSVGWLSFPPAKGICHLATTFQQESQDEVRLLTSFAP